MPLPLVPCPARRARALAAVALAVLALGAGCGGDDNANPPAADGLDEVRLERTVERTMEEYGVPGAVVVVDVPGEGRWELARGTTELDGDQPVETDMVWPLRSITKSFTVTLLLQLVDEGRISLEDTIDRWVPGVPNGDRITLRQLADMTSGVPEYITEDFVADFSADPGAAFELDRLIGYALTEPPVAEPGAEHVYINTSTLLLGKVVEEVTGASFASVLAERILEPLGLDATDYPAEADGWSGPHATGYQPGESGELEAPTNNFTVFGPAGAMTSTAEDLLVWGPALATGGLVLDATQQERLEGAPLDEGPEYDRYAMGIGEIDGWWGHTGEGFGYTALVMHRSDTGATVVIFMTLSNVDRHVPTVLFRRLAAQLDG